jgi:hypothetical protein
VSETLPPSDCRWHADGNPEAAPTIIAFLAAIGIPVVTSSVGDSVLPGMTVRSGAIHVDRLFETWPGDLLHEAGHFALTDPSARGTTPYVSDDPGEEMGAIAWSWAAAVHLGLEAKVLFHAAGYRGAALSLAENYRTGGTMGVPILAMYGMTAEPHRAAEQGIAAYPVMQRWLR